MKQFFLLLILLMSISAHSNMFDARIDGVIDQSRGASDLMEMFYEECEEKQELSESQNLDVEWMPEQIKKKHVFDEM